MMISATWSAESGAWWAGFTTTALPAARAGATLCMTRLNGALNGVTAATMPSGSRMTNAVRPSPPGTASGAGIASPNCSIAAAAAPSVYVLRSISRRESLIALPVWRLIVLARNSLRPRMSLDGGPESRRPGVDRHRRDLALAVPGGGEGIIDRGGVGQPDLADDLVARYGSTSSRLRARLDPPAADDRAGVDC